MQKEVEQYLIHCYLYYKLDTSVISDAEFDQLCKELLDSGIEHPLVSKSDLAAGTGYSISEYPAEIIQKAEKLLEKKPVSAPAGHEWKPFEFTHTPTETYLLLGMYIDYGLHQMRDRQNEIWPEIHRRWQCDIDSEMFHRYFKDHNVGPERFKLI